MTLARPLLAAASALTLSALVAGPAGAGAFYIQEQSVKGLGRAYSGEGADTGADSLWWNPASIAEIEGVQTYSGIHTVFVTGTLRDAGSTVTQGGVTRPVGGEPRADNPILFGVVPNSGAAWRVNDRVSVGLAVTAPFNFTTKYDAASWTRYDAQKSFLLSIDVQPTVALHLTKWLDVGAGFDAEYVYATLTNALPNLAAGGPDGAQRLSGDGWDYGYTVGAQLHPTSRASLGLSYRSAIDHTLDGQVTANVLLGPSTLLAIDSPGTAKFTTPWMATASARYALTDSLSLNAQVQRIGWGEFKAIAVASTGIPTNGGVQVTPERYRSTTSEALGVDYKVNPLWTVRAGVQYDPTPTRNSNRSARVPDGNRLLFGAGTTLQVSRKLSFDLAGAYIHFDDSRVNSASNPTGFSPVDLTGSVEGEGVVLSGGAHYRF